MGLFFKDDPVFSLIHSVLKANVLSVPDARIVTLGVIEKPPMGTPKFRTTISTILDKPTDLELNTGFLSTKPMSNIAGEQTQATDLNAGLQMLRGFLKGFGVSLPNLTAHFKDVSKVAFSFENIERTWADNGLLALEFKDQTIVRNAMTQSFFGFPASKLLLIDSVIKSSDFSIHATETTRDSFSFDLDSVQHEMGAKKDQLSVEVQGSHTLTFRSSLSLPFAFTCIHLRLDDQGRVFDMPAFVKPMPNMMQGREGEEWPKEQLSDDFFELEFANP